MQKTTLKNLKFQFIEKSGNKKTGYMPVTYNSAATCPNSCIFKNNGCYASAGFHTRLNWDKVTAGKRGGSFKELLNKDSEVESLKDLYYRHKDYYKKGK